jgi:hypothetical protein
MPARQCPFCGKMISDLHSHCPFCREAVPPVPGSQAAIRSSLRVRNCDGSRKLRQGLLYMLLAGVIQYIAGGYGGSFLKLPIQVQPVVTSYLVPLLFLCGLGLSVYGFFLHARPTS